MDIKLTLDTQAFADLADELSAGAPLRRLFSMLQRGGCKTVVIESDASDDEWQAEYDALYSKAFVPYSDKVTRLHYFESEWDGAVTTGDFLQGAAGSYLGYSDRKSVV